MNHGTTSTLCGLTLLAAACASGRNGEPEAPPGFELVYAQDFEDPRAAQDFVASDPRAWRVAREGGNGFLELFAASRYQPPHRSPLAIAVLVGPVVGDFVLELDVQQTGREYDHRDLCFFFGVRDPAHYGYAHLATRADDTAHHVHLVEAADRRPVTSARTFGVDWGSARWRHVRLVREARSGRVRVWLDDDPEPVLEGREGTLGEGWIGLGSFDDTGRFDNLRLFARDLEVRSPTFFGPLGAGAPP